MDAPRFTVVVPTHDRLELLRIVLAAYDVQSPRELSFEVIVVDDGSRDGTAEWASQWQSDRYAYRFLRQPQQGPAAARNLALRSARGDYVLFTGDDIEPTPTLVAEHLRAHDELARPQTAVLGRIQWHPAAALTATMVHVDGVGAQQFSFHYMQDGTEYDFRHFYTSNVSVRRDLLECEPSYFSTDFRHAAFEDAEYSWRLVPHGLRIVYRAAALAWHHHPYGARSFFGRQVRCGEMAVVIIRKYPALREIVGMAPLRWRARQRLAGGFARRRRIAALAARLEEHEEAAIRRAEAWDPTPGPDADRVLLPLFGYGYLRGAAPGLLGRRAARRFCAALLLDALAGPLGSAEPPVAAGGPRPVPAS